VTTISRRTLWNFAIPAGVVTGVVYSLSPLTVVCLAGMTAVVLWAQRGVEGDERRWLTAILVVAITMRVLAVAGLFVITDHARVPFGSFFGDEEYFIKRSIWLRNVALGIPLHGADLIYAFDEYSSTTYLYVLAFIQALTGPAPYGVHLLGIGFYLGAVVVLYRLVRSTLGRMPALVGLIALLFLPTQFAWSISALKDPLFFLLTAVSVVLTAKIVRGPGWRARVLSALAVVVLAAALETIRQAGGILCAAGVVIGLLTAFIVQRPRLLLATVVVLPIAAGAMLSRPAAQMAAYKAVQAAARQHWGHVATPGYVYHLLDPRLYPDRSEIEDLHFGEAARFVERAVERYVTVPLPWETQSASALLYMPEQIIWYLLVALAPVGLVLAMRRDAVIASLLFAQSIVAAATIALTSGNVGTLVRHRGLALPYFIWLCAVALCDLVALARRGRSAVLVSSVVPVNS
jgi:hypothetical protein